jgi:integrase/recombinase XerD
MARASLSKWNETLTDFENYLLQKNKARNSITAYLSTLKMFATFYQDELKKPGPYVSRLQETDLHAFVDYLRSTRYLAASSVNCAIAALHSFCRYLLEQQKHKRDIGKELRTYYVEPPPKSHVLSQQEVRRLITSVDLNTKNGPRNLAILQLMLQCGFRVGEITRLCYDDVVIQKTTGHVRVRDKKTLSERFVPLNASTRSALKKYLHICDTSSGTSPLFSSQHNKKISEKTVQYMIKKYLCAAGRSDLSARDLRHHFAIELYKSNKSLPVVQKILGHRNLATTARYIQPTDQELSEALEGLPGNVYHEEGSK